MSMLTAAFADPVLDAQRCFRAVLDAMSRPGQVHTIGGVEPPAPLGVAAAAVLLTVADHETPMWLGTDIASVRPWLEFHCGSPVVADPSDATFALSIGLPDLGAFPAGSHEAPEASATLIVQLPALEGGPTLRLTGPGIRADATIAPMGLPPDFVAQWSRNRALFPAGVDLVLCAGDRLAAFPRTLSIAEV